MSSNSLPGPSMPRFKVSMQELRTTSESPEASLGNLTTSQSTLGAESMVTISTGTAMSTTGSTAWLHPNSLKKKKSLRGDPDRHIIFGIGKDDRDFWRNEETLEKPPIIDHYRRPLEKTDPNIARPSMYDLMHGSFRDITAIPLDDYKESGDKEKREGGAIDDKMAKFEPPEAAGRVKFGWIQGVMIRCILNILGVMLFLRVSWVAAQAGLLLGSVVILLAATVTTLTTLSMSAISTNGDVKGGGTYFMISRSLGPEFGGSIGVMFSFANAVGAAMHIVGLSETVRDLMKYNGAAIIDNGLNDVRIVGLAMCSLLMMVVFIGTAFESRTQVALLVILTISLLNYILGTFMPVTEFQQQRGITGYSFETFSENLMPAWRGHDFFSIFGIFFPAATGIMAGANISGDLKNPSKAIPKGTLGAIAITTGIYLMALWMTGVTSVRDASGVTAAMLAAANDTSIYSEKLNCLANYTCEFGLMNFYQVMEVESIWGPMVTAGIFAATLSSALASLVSAPKIFQAVCKDRLFPYIKVFGKGYGREEEPRRAYALVFVITMLVILIGDLNVIAPIISNFFLAAYALINYACFDASFSRSPGFRPTFKYYNKWVSLLGAAICVTIMFIISWWTALITFCFFAMLFVYIQRRKPDANWGSSTQANSYRNALMSVLKLTNTEEHVKNYRPQLLVLTGSPADRAALVDFASNITKGNSLLICGH
uniref:Amino acid permease/ SLC12A domain-containing protein n=1 Tax=Plectus sambesii TaxID=2011161 RepID=A0A914W591_9BILA